MVRRRRLFRKVGFASSASTGRRATTVQRSSSRESAGDWSRPSTPPSSGSESIKDGYLCEELALEKAEVLHMHHPVVALVRRQLSRLLAEDMALATSHQVEEPPAALAPTPPPRPSLRPLARSPTTPPPALLQVLAPVLGLLLVAVVSAASAVLGVLTAYWHSVMPPPRPPGPAPSCLGRLLAALLPSWSRGDDMPLVRPF